MEENRMTMVIKTKNHEEQKRIGEQICDQLTGNPDYIDSNIVVNYTDSNSTNVYVIVGAEAKETSITLLL